MKFTTRTTVSIDVDSEAELNTLLGKIETFVEGEGGTFSSRIITTGEDVEEPAE